MGDCVQDLGHERPEASLSWHQIDPDKVEVVKPDRSDTDAAAPCC